MKAPGDVELLVQRIQVIPVVGMPEVALDQVGPDERAHGAEFGDAADEFLAGQVDVVDRQHRRKL